MAPADVNAPNTYRCFVIRTGMQFEAWLGFPWKVEAEPVCGDDGIAKRYLTEASAYRAAWLALAGRLNSAIRSDHQVSEVERVFGASSSSVQSKGRSIPVSTKQRKAR